MPFPEIETPTNTRAAAVNEPAREIGPDDDLLSLAQSDPEEVVRRMREEWDRSWEEIQNIDAQWKVNLARSDGYIGARLEKRQDKQEAFIPLGAGPSITGLNKAVRLSRRLATTILADPPVPEVVPSSGQDVSADSAEFQSRILKDESGEGKLDVVVLAGDALERAKDYGSGFVHFYVDPEGRGPQPVRIKAHPDAVSADDPMLDQVREAGGSVEPKAPVLRYVTADGGLTDDRFGQPLQHQFVPKLCADTLTGRHVRFLPGTARDIWDASGVLVGAMVPLVNAKASFPVVRRMSETDLAELVSYRPKRAKDMLPVEQRKYLDQGRLTDSSLIFQLLRYELPSAKNPKGSYLVALGDKVLAHSGVWWDEEHDQPLDLPVTQFVHIRSPGNPYGSGSMEWLGPGNELLALMLDAMLEHLDRFGDAKTFVPTTSSLRPEQMEGNTHRYIPVSPGGMPVFEQIPDFPVVVEKMHARISQDMDDESGLQQAGQAIQAANITSARQFTANVQQVQVLLSDLRQNTGRALIRGWRIMAQLVRTYYSIPQLLQWQGDDGGYHVKEWSGTDLLGMTDVRIAQGSFTGMVPAQKAALARSLYLEDKVLTPQEYRRIITRQFDAHLALQDDPHYQRVKRQLDRWKDGPPEGWQPPQAPVDQYGEPLVDPQTGQPMPTPPDPQLAAIFAALPCDEEPGVAQMRVVEFSRVMASSRFERSPAAWQAGLVQAYDAARKAAGMQTVAEQQAGQAQAAEGQQAAQQQAAQAQAQAASAKAQATQVKAAADIQKVKMQSEVDLATAALRKEGELLDVQAAQAARGIPVGV